MIAVALAGGALGLGVALLVWALAPGRPALAATLALTRGGRGWVEERRRPDGDLWRWRLGHLVLQASRALGFEGRSLQVELRVTGRSMESLFAEKALAALAGALMVPAAAALLALAGVRLGPIVPLVGGLVLGTVGFVVPNLALRSTAAARRRTFRHATGSFLDLVAVNLAGGMGIESALHHAVAVGQGWAFARLGDALARARLSGSPPWVELGRVGDELDIHELTELAASLVLAGNEGAKVRQSLAAKALSLRRHELAEEEAAAAEGTERMALPLGLLFMGFLLFLGYPAVMKVLVGL